ncbi:MAG: alpha/beta fold hydrolase, partial [Cyanobacteria bacterium P01_A01_bin.135]
ATLRGRQVEITYIVLHSSSPLPKPDPVVHLVGGPGGSAVGSLNYRTDIFQTLRRSRDIVLFDQRGTQYSSRLDCNPYFQVLSAQVEDDPELASQLEELAAEDEQLTPSILQTQIAMSACARGMSRLGVDLSQYNSVNNVRDITALVSALGYQHFNLYGISYGTRLALTLMRDGPYVSAATSPVTLRSVVLDSAYPVQINNYENTTNLNEEVIQQLFEDCTRDAVCRTEYPNLEARFGALLTRLDESPIAVDEPIELFFSGQVVRQVTPAIARLLVSRFLDGEPWFAPYFPRIIHELEAGETATLALALSGQLRDDSDPTAPADPAALPTEERRSQVEVQWREEARREVRQRPGYSWLNNAYDLASDLPEPIREEALLELNLINAAPRTAGTLKQYVEAYFTEEPATTLLADLEALSPDQVRAAFEVISDLNNSGSTEGMHYSVECHEEFAFNDRERAQAIYEGLSFPLLGTAGWTVTNQIEAVCAVWPSGRAAAIENEPVASDVPTLVMAGAYDSQTPPSWNQLALTPLTNAHYVAFPNTGHGAIAYSHCAQQVSAAFIDAPTQPPDSDCTQTLQPRFVGLEEPLN